MITMGRRRNCENLSNHTLAREYFKVLNLRSAHEKINGYNNQQYKDYTKDMYDLILEARKRDFNLEDDDCCALRDGRENL